MFPPAVAAVFTVAFAATGLYSFARSVRLSAQVGPRGHSSGQARVTELLHLLMSVAMIAMARGWSGGPGTGSGVVQLVVFGLFTVLFALFAARASDLAGVVGRAAHALMAAAMVWMVAAMPLLMGHTAAAGAAGGEPAGHGAMAGMDMGAGTAGAAPPDAPGWALAVNGLVAAVLVASAVFWVVRVVRTVRPGTLADADVPPATADVSPGAPAGHHGVVAATCHTVMSLGMVAMLLLMP